jgi:peptidoglycan/xylan/chitin deacetylase (PgdA/CDA1 family)
MQPTQSYLKPLIYAWTGAGQLAKYGLGLQHEPRRIWLTFDDGPHPIYTPVILDVLKTRNVRAAFFMIGEHAQQYPDIVRRASDEGHRVANHSYSHPRLTSLSEEDVRAEIIRSDEVLRPFIGGGDKLFRPPHGATNTLVDRVVTECGYQTMLWNLSGRDWDHPRFERRWVDLTCVMIRLMGQSTVVLHDTMPGTAEHMERFINRVLQLDGQFESPDTLLSRFGGSA